jgi:hypothetical protein
MIHGHCRLQVPRKSRRKSDQNANKLCNSSLSGHTERAEQLRTLEMLVLGKYLAVSDCGSVTLHTSLTRFWGGRYGFEAKIRQREE